MWHTDHPGTPSQVFGATVLHLSHQIFFQRNESFVISVLKNPENYMRILVVVGAALNAIILFILGLSFFKIGVTPLFAISGQVFCALSPAVIMHSFGRFAAEPLLFFFSLASCIFWVYAFRENPVSVEVKAGKRETSILLAVVFSLVFSGFACGVKITAFPLILLGIFTLRTITQKVIGVSVFVAAFFLATVVTAPWRNFLVFFGKLLTHKGRYGGGERGWVDIKIYVANMLNLLAVNWVFSLTLILLLISLVFSKLILAKVHRQLLGGSFAAMATSLLVVGKHPAPHYLIPGMVIAGVSLALLASKVTVSFAQFRKQIVPVVMGCLVCLTILFLAFSLSEANDRRKEHVEGQVKSEIARQSYDNKNLITVFLAGSGCTEQGLYLGNSWAWYTYRKQLSEIYPNTLFFPFGATTLSGFDGEEQARLLLSSKKKLLLIGDSIPPSNLYSNLFRREKNFYKNSHWLMRDQ
ncbi:MAG: hypothetical protein J0L75_08230 [Spirochaetes bacterium]|nr:hypothetical protein [Spirochaetota bacterium]